jgi:hypothetical protein
MEKEELKNSDNDLPLLKIDNYSSEDNSVSLKIKFKDGTESDISDKVSKENRMDLSLENDPGEIDKIFVIIGDDIKEMFQIENRMEWEYPENARAGDTINIFAVVSPVFGYLNIIDNSTQKLEKIEITVTSKCREGTSKTFTGTGKHPTGWLYNCINNCEIVVKKESDNNDRPSVHMSGGSGNWKHVIPGDNINVAAYETSGG